MLFGEDVDATSEELPEALSFQHRLLQEMVAAYYIADQVKVNPTFLEAAFPSCREIESHKEVLRFSCGLLAGTNTGAEPIIDYMAKILAKLTRQQVHEGDEDNCINLNRTLIAKEDLAIYQSLQKEGCVSNVNKYFCNYPTCGRPLAEVLATTELALISGVDENDVLDVKSSSAEVIMYKPGKRREPVIKITGKEDYGKLWKSLREAKANIVTSILCASDIGQNKLNELIMSMCSDSHGSDMDLKYCHLVTEPDVKIPSSFLKTVCTWKHLSRLELNRCDLSTRVNMLLDSPPPALRVLRLTRSRLLQEDVIFIGDCVRQYKLKNLEVLDIRENPITDSTAQMMNHDIDTALPGSQLAVEHLLNAFLTKWMEGNQRQKIRKLDCMENGDKHMETICISTFFITDDLDYWREIQTLSFHFVYQWKCKLEKTNIKLH